jgi:hypothetical protein
MAIEQLFNVLNLRFTQHSISKFGVADFAFAGLVTVAFGILADYIWMLYLRSKMVCKNFDGDVLCAKDHSHQALCHFPSLVTLTTSPTASHGYTLKSSPKSTTHHW